MRMLRTLTATTLAVSLAAALGLAACGSSSATDTTATTSEETNTEALDETVKGQANTGTYEVDLGTSNIYDEATRQNAVNTIMTEFDTWTGCTMISIRYNGDQASQDNLAYVNELRKDGEAPFADAIVFKTDFQSPSAELSKGTAWEPDTLYADYEWYLARPAGGAWRVVTCGY